MLPTSFLSSCPYGDNARERLDNGILICLYGDTVIIITVLSDLPKETFSVLLLLLFFLLLFVVGFFCGFYFNFILFIFLFYFFWGGGGKFVFNFLIIVIMI